VDSFWDQKIKVTTDDPKRDEYSIL